MKNILVTGGAGFLGSHLTKRLINDGNYVICLDSLLTGSLEHLKMFNKSDKFMFVRHDITNKIDIDLQIDEIYNLACPASPKHYQNNPVHTIQTNVLGTINVLEIAKKNNSKILQASTSEIYGDPLIHPQIEDYWGNVNPIGVRSCYDEGKRCAETLLFDYNRQYNLRIKIARIFNTYGPNMAQNDGRVISNFIIQSLKGKPISIYGNGKQTRSFCYVDDMIDALILLMNTNDSFQGPVNIGNPQEFTIKEIAKLVIDISNSKSKLDFKELPFDDPKRRKPSIKLAREILRWSPAIDIKDGIYKTIKYFESII